MNRGVIRVATVGAAVLTAQLLVATPAQATVHEIVGQWCSGHDPLGPPGISGGSKADNVAKPLFANGFIGDPVPFDPEGDQPAGLLIPFNYQLPASKVVGTGVYFAIDTTPAGPLYIEAIAPDPTFPAFQRCPRLATG
ncbi:hypothetical protein GCM10009623_14920 [Nocardioides aestuarii]|uniref:Uncharacterized protein n=1 Tax=Nocardioides aestuarii TaxID=252231 RepID=A0ABW4TNF6_9ACTN